MPLVIFIVSIVASSALGDFIAKKTGRKTIGWPIGILAFFIAMAVMGNSLP